MSILLHFLKIKTFPPAQATVLRHGSSWRPVSDGPSQLTLVSELEKT